MILLLNYDTDITIPVVPFKSVFLDKPYLTFTFLLGSLHCLGKYRLILYNDIFFINLTVEGIIIALPLDI